MAKRKSASAAARVDRDAGPELTEEWFATADLDHGDRLVRRGRPRSRAPKEAVNIRLDADVLAHYRATGAGWQSRINKDLRKAAKLKANG